MLHEAKLYSIAVWAIFFGIVFSIFYISKQKKAIGTFIAKLIENDSFDTDTAKSLLELGITDSISTYIIFRGVRYQHGLIRIIGFTGKDISKAPTEFSGAVPNENTKFYIDKYSADDAKKKYNTVKSNKLYLAICIVVLFVIACVASTVISKLTSYAGNVFKDYGSYKPKQEDTIQNDDENSNEDNDSETNVTDNDEISSEENIVDPNITDDDIENSDESANETHIKPTIPKGPLS